MQSGFAFFVAGIDQGLLVKDEGDYSRVASVFERHMQDRIPSVVPLLYRFGGNKGLEDRPLDEHGLVKGSNAQVIGGENFRSVGQKQRDKRYPVLLYRKVQRRLPCNIPNRNIRASAKEGLHYFRPAVQGNYNV